MDALKIEATEISPKITFDPEVNFFEMAGESRPENVRKFFEPVVAWLDEFGLDLVNHKREEIAIFNFRFDYFNSSSAKFIMDILKKLEDLHRKGAKIQVRWYYDEGDEDMQETGEEFSKIIEVPFEYIEVPDED